MPEQSAGGGVSRRVRRRRRSAGGCAGQYAAGVPAGMSVAFWRSGLGGRSTSAVGPEIPVQLWKALTDAFPAGSRKPELIYLGPARATAIGTISIEIGEDPDRIPKSPTSRPGPFVDLVMPDVWRPRSSGLPRRRAPVSAFKRAPPRSRTGIPAGAHAIGLWARFVIDHTEAWGGHRRETRAQSTRGPTSRDRAAEQPGSGDRSPRGRFGCGHLGGLIGIDFSIWRDASNQARCRTAAEKEALHTTVPASRWERSRVSA